MKNLFLFFVAFCISLCTFGQSRESAVYYHPELALEGSLEVQHQLLQRTDTKPSVHRAPHKADAVGYNAFLSCGTTGYSISNMSGQIRKTVSFVISNNGESDIELTKLTVKHSKTLLDVTSTTSAEYLGLLGAGQSKGLSVTLTSDIDVVFEWEYTYNGESYIFQSWDYTVTKVEAITLNYSELDLMAGEKATLTAIVSPADATVPDLTWESENKSVAVIDGAGNVMGIAPGETAIKVSAVDGSGVTSKCRVRVTPNTSELEDPDIYNPYLSSYSTGYSQFNNKKTINFTLQNRGNESIYVTRLTIKRSDTLDNIYTSTDTSLLGNLDAGGSFGLSYTVYQDISFAFEWEYLYHGHSYIYQSWKSYPFKVRGITLDYTYLELGLGETATLTATVAPAEAKGNVEWSSSDEGVVTVDNAGNLTTVGAGTATITVASKDDASKCATCEVTVIKYSISSITIDSEDLVLPIGEEAMLTATSSPSNAYNKNVVWTSSNEQVATVSAEGHVKAIAEGETLITVSSEENPAVNASVKVTVIDTEVREISLNIAEGELKVSESLQLKANVLPETAVNKNILWASSDKSVATVSDSGLVEAIGLGSVTITAQSESNPEVTATANITVVPTMVESIVLNYATYTINRREHLQLTASVSPKDATNGNVRWASSDTSVAEVDENGLVTAKAGGTAVVTATACDGSGVMASCEIVVIGKPDVGYNPYLSSRSTGYSYTSWTGYMYGFELRNNGEESIEVTKCTVMDGATHAVLTTSSDASLLGNLAPGEAKSLSYKSWNELSLVFEWEYTYHGKTYVFQSWERYYTDAESVELNQTTMTLERGTTAQLKATVLPTVAMNEVTWTTSNAEVATVDNTGLITAVGLGIATITATTTDDTDLSATCEVTVVPACAKSVTLSADVMDIVIGDAFTITANVDPENAESKDIAWSIDNTDVVRMTTEGEFEAIGVGNATITASVIGTEVSASCSVNVLPVLVSAITLSQTAAELIKGETLLLTASVSPKDATNGNVRWASSDTSVAEVDEYGLVTAMAGGTAVITATACDGSGVVASCEIVVIGKPDYGYNPYLSSRTTGYSYTTFTGYMYGFELRNNGNEEIEVTKCTIKDAATLATLSVGTDANMLGSLAPGNAISLSFKTWNESSFAFEWEYLYNDKTYVFKSWEHYYADAETVTLSETTMAIEIGTTSQLKATILPSVAMQDVKWTSSDESIASVDAEGHVTGINIGKALITATTTDDTDLEAQCVVSVIPQKIMPTGLRLSVTEIIAAIDEHFTITATIEPEDSDFKQIEWTISNPNVIEMLADGEFVATSIGTATITATIVGTGVSATCEVTTYDPNVFTYYLKVKDQDLYLAIDSEDNDGRTNNVISAAHLSVKEKASLLIMTEETEGWKIEDAVTHRVLGKSTRYSWNFSNMDTDVALWSVEPSDDALLLRGSNGYWKTNSVADGSYLYHDGRPRDLLWELIPVRETDISMEINCTSASLHVGESKQLTVAIVPLQVLQGGILWSSNNNAVATVSEEGLVTAISLGTAIITATLESNPEVKAMATITVKPIDVTSITLDKTSCELVLGQTATIKASINPTDATDKGILWSTDNALIATVTSNGTVKAVGKGTTTITATSKSNPDIKATLKVTVKATDVTSISLNKTACQIKVGESEELIATIAPNTATDKGIVWTSSNKTVATVSANGIVTALAEGTTTITASSHSNPEVKATATVQVVNNVKVESIYLNIEEFTIEVGYNRTLTVGFVPANADNTGISWISDNTTIARVDPVTGKIIGVSEGTAVITATSNDNPDAKVSVTVHVIDRNVKSITLNYTEYELWPGESVKLEAVVSPDNAKSKNVVWSTDNANVATVSSNGTVKAVAPGIVTITAKSDVNSKVSATATITVLGLATDISLNYSSYALAKGESVQLVAYVSPDVASQQPITWSSSNEGIITVNANGLCTCIGDGTATVTATTTDGSELSASCTFDCLVGINEVEVTALDEEFYSLDGIKHSRAKKGINVVRQKDGKTIKMFNSHNRQ